MIDLFSFSYIKIVIFRSSNVKQIKSQNCCNFVKFIIAPHMQNPIRIKHLTGTIIETLFIILSNKEKTDI